jgi:aldose 1-epimerase
MVSVRVHNWRGEAAVTLDAGGLAATFLPDLGMLGTSLRHRGEELLALPGGLARYKDGHVMGLPLLAPWANRLAGRRYRVDGVAVDLAGLPLPTDGNGLPIHGTMTARRGWQVDRLQAGTSTACLRARFDYGARQELLASFPFPHELTVEATVNGGALTVATTLRPTGDRRVPVSFGWHPYLRLPGSPRRAWRLRLPERTHLLLDELGLPTGASNAEPPRTPSSATAVSTTCTPWTPTAGWRSPRTTTGSPSSSSAATPTRRSSSRPASGSSAWNR